MAKGLKPQTISSDSSLGSSVIERSLRFNSGDSTSLTRTPSDTSNRRTYTLSFWFKINSVGLNYIFECGSTDANNNRLYIRVDSSSLFSIGEHSIYRLITTQKLRDTSTWYHIVFAVDTTLATADNRNRLYINGEEVTSFSTRNNFSQDLETGVNRTNIHNWGRSDIDSNYSNLYLTEINFIDGYQYDASYFGFTDSQTGIWMPKRYEGTYGTNGYHLNFSDNSSTSTLGKDTSGNGNDFTANNFSVSAGTGNDSLEDTPTNNFCTLNPNDTWRDNSSTSDGNLKFTRSASNFGAGRAGFAVKSGKWYFEFTKGSGLVQAGFVNTDHNINYNGGDVGLNSANSNPCGIAYDSRGSWYGYTGSSPSSIADDDIIGVAFDADNFKFYFHKNGTYYGSGNPSTGENGIAPNASNTVTKTDSMLFAPYFNAENGNGYANFGQRPFSYTIPSGYKTLQTKNLPPNVPSIVRPKKHFDTLLYTGNNSTQKITGLEFKPDFVWFKSRTSTSWNALFDSVRGNTQGLAANETNTEYTSSASNDLVSFDISGFTLGSNQNWGSVNGSSNSIVAWCWKAGGAAVTNNDGNTTSQVSVNQEAGFSIVTYAGSGQPRTIGHGLGKKPAWIITKSRDSSDDWMVWHQSIHTSNIGNYSISLNGTGGRDDDSKYWYDVVPTSTVFTRGNYSSGDNMVAYCWAEIPGFSKFGKYFGNANSDGPFIHLGFRPAWLLVRRIDSGDHWILRDSARNTFNDTYSNLLPNSNAAESGSSGSVQSIDFLSNGFKLRGTDSGVSSSSGTYIYMAFAEQPGTTPFDTFPNAR